jgi:hypothetical protein
MRRAKYILFFSITFALVLMALETSGIAAAEELVTTVENAKSAYSEGNLEKAYNEFVKASYSVASELATRYNEKPLVIKSVEFKKELEETSGVELRLVEPLFNLPDEFYLVVRVDNLNMEESNGKFRFHIKEYLRLVGPDGNEYLNENPVDLFEDYREFMTDIKVTNRVPILPEWPEGEYKATVAVEDGLEGDTKEARAETVVNFNVKKIAQPDSTGASPVVLPENPPAIPKNDTKEIEK